MLQNGRSCHLDLVWRERISDDDETCLFKLGEIACFFFAAQHRDGACGVARPARPRPAVGTPAASAGGRRGGAGAIGQALAAPGRRMHARARAPPR